MALRHLQEVSTTLRQTQQTQGPILKLIKTTCNRVAIWLCRTFKPSLSQDRKLLMGLLAQASRPQVLTKLNKIDKPLSCTLQRSPRGDLSHRRFTKGSSASNLLALIKHH
jgi:hypothetical protein